MQVRSPSVEDAVGDGSSQFSFTLVPRIEPRDEASGYFDRQQSVIFPKYYSTKAPIEPIEIKDDPFGQDFYVLHRLITEEDEAEKIENMFLYRDHIDAVVQYLSDYETEDPPTPNNKSLFGNFRDMVLEVVEVNRCTADEATKPICRCTEDEVDKAAQNKEDPCLHLIEGIDQDVVDLWEKVHKDLVDEYYRIR